MLCFRIPAPNSVFTQTEKTSPSEAGPRPSISKTPEEVQSHQDVVVDFRNLLELAKSQKIQQEKSITNP